MRKIRPLSAIVCPVRLPVRRAIVLAVRFESSSLQTDLFQFLKIAKRETSLVLGLENFEEQVLSSILVSKI